MGEDLFELVVGLLTIALKQGPDRNSEEGGSTASWTMLDATFEVGWVRSTDAVSIVVVHKAADPTINSMLERALVGILREGLADGELATIKATGSVATYPILLMQKAT